MFIDVLLCTLMFLCEIRAVKIISEDDKKRIDTDHVKRSQETVPHDKCNHRTPLINVLSCTPYYHLHSPSTQLNPKM